MEVQQDVETLAAAPIDHALQQGEAALPVRERLQVRLEVPVVERQPDVVEAKVPEVREVLLGEVGVHVPVPEGVLGGLAEHLAERVADDVVDLRQPEHEVLDQHPVADADAPERYGPTVGADLSAGQLEEGERGGLISSIEHARTSDDG